MRKAIIDSPKWTLQYGHLFLKSLDDKMASNRSVGGVQMAIYTLKDIPDNLWKEAKKKAIDHDITMKDLLIQLLRDWTQKKNES